MRVCISKSMASHALPGTRHAIEGAGCRFTRATIIHSWQTHDRASNSAGEQCKKRTRKRGSHAKRGQNAAKMACTDAQTTDLPPVLHPSATAAPALLHGGRIALCLNTAEKVAGQFAQNKGREGPQGWKSAHTGKKGVKLTLPP